MDRNKAIEKLRECQNSGDTECAQLRFGEADDIICELLTSLGYQDVVKEYDLVDKWFA